MKHLYFFLSLLLLVGQAEAQEESPFSNRRTSQELEAAHELFAGPFISYVDHHSTRFWLLVNKEVKTVRLDFEDFDQERTFSESYEVGKLGDYQKNRWKRVSSPYLLGDKVPVIIDVQNLNIDEDYNVKVFLDDKEVVEEFTFYMQRVHPADVHFLFGGGYEMTESAKANLKTMVDMPNDFMVWGGNNFGVSPNGYDFKDLSDHIKNVRSLDYVNEFMRSTPQIATWGEKDVDGEGKGMYYLLRDTAQQVFDLMWPNIPKKVYNYTFKNYGTYAKYDYEDIDLFLLDDQSFRDSKHRTTKYGMEQLERCFNEVWGSNASFKIFVSNTSFFDPEDEESLLNYQNDFTEFMTRLDKGNFGGVFFLSTTTGESEIIVHERSSGYPLYELRVRNLGLEHGNFAKVKVDGSISSDSRKVTLQVFDSSGKTLIEKTMARSAMQ